MEISELIKQLQALQTKYGKQAKVFTLNEVGTPVELIGTGVYAHIHENQLKIFIEG